MKKTVPEGLWLFDHYSSTELLHVPIHTGVSAEFLYNKLDLTRFTMK